jgi:hypothetical protein
MIKLTPQQVLAVYRPNHNRYQSHLMADPAQLRASFPFQIPP